MAAFRKKNTVFKAPSTTPFLDFLHLRPPHRQGPGTKWPGKWSEAELTRAIETLAAAVPRKCAG